MFKSIHYLLSLFNFVKNKICGILYIKTTKATTIILCILPMKDSMRLVIEILDVAPRNDGIVPVADRPQNLLPVLLFRGLENQLN